VLQFHPVFRRHPHKSSEPWKIYEETPTSTCPDVETTNLLTEAEAMELSFRRGQIPLRPPPAQIPLEKNNAKE
jgi:hypothetical protein